jgi:hypothetical protein
MKKKIDFNSLLPSQNSQDYKRVKEDSPYAMLIEYSKAFNEKYNGKIVATVTESFQLRSKPGSLETKENLVLALYLQAAIGSGYLYRLLEIEQIKSEPFPVKVSVFQNSPSTLGTYKDYISFVNDIVKFLGSGFVKTLILNLLAQVELYNESRSENFEIDNDIQKK